MPKIMSISVLLIIENSSRSVFLCNMLENVFRTRCYAKIAIPPDHYLKNNNKNNKKSTKQKKKKIKQMPQKTNTPKKTPETKPWYYMKVYIQYFIKHTPCLLEPYTLFPLE